MLRSLNAELDELFADSGSPSIVAEVVTPPGIARNQPEFDHQDPRPGENEQIGDRFRIGFSQSLVRGQIWLR